jgi:hypothetical protein
MIREIDRREADCRLRYPPVLRHACRVADLDFFVDVVVSGAVLGVGLTDSPDEVARTLGGDFAEDRNRAVMRRDYGLVEFSWARRPGSGSWQATGSTVQAQGVELAVLPSADDIVPASSEEADAHARLGQCTLIGTATHCARHGQRDDSGRSGRSLSEERRSSNAPAGAPIRSGIKKRQGVVGPSLA